MVLIHSRGQGGGVPQVHVHPPLGLKRPQDPSPNNFAPPISNSWLRPCLMYLNMILIKVHLSPGILAKGETRFENIYAFFILQITIRSYKQHRRTHCSGSSLGERWQWSRREPRAFWSSPIVSISLLPWLWTSKKLFHCYVLLSLHVFAFSTHSRRESSDTSSPTPGSVKQ